MDTSRRRLLKISALGALSGLAGCTDSGVTYPEESAGLASNEKDVTVIDTDSQNAAPENTTTTKQATYDELATATDEILSELEWFATSYTSAMLQFQARAGRARDTVATLRRQPKLSQSHIDRLVESTNNLITYLDQTLGPHFDSTNDVTQRIDGHVSTILTFAKRGDLDRVDQELGSLMVYLEKLTLSATIDDLFSESPAHDRLFDLLVSESYEPSRPLAFLLGDPDNDYVLTAKVPPSERESSWQFAPQPLPLNADYQKSNFFAELDTIFEGVSIQTQRDRRAFMSIHPNYDVDVPARLAYVQQFASPEAATSALEMLKEETVTQEGERQIGSHTWQRIYHFQELHALDDDTGYLEYEEDIGMIFDSNGGVYREKDGVSRIINGGEARPDVEGDVIYSYLLQAGHSLITISPSMTAWNERPKKTEDVFAYTWLQSTPSSA